MINVPGLTETQVTEIINKVAENHKQKSFDYHSSEDIFQKVWEIVLEKLPFFELDRGLYDDPQKCLEHWLNTVVSRRLSNYKRDTFDVKQKARKNDKSPKEVETRKSLAYPVELNVITENCLGVYDDDIINNEYIKIIWESLEPKHRDILDAVLSGEKIQAYYRNQLANAIREIDGEE